MTALFLNLLILIAKVTLTLTDLGCKQQGDCNDVNHIKCGICVDGDSPGKGKCIFPFPYKFKDGKKCTEATDCEQNCNSHGYCKSKIFPEFESSGIIPSCICNSEFYGKTCEYSTPKHLVGILSSFVVIEFIGSQQPNEHKYREAYYECGPHKYFDTYLELECGDKGYYTSHNLSKINCQRPSKTFDYFIAKYPYKPIKDDQEILTLRNDVLGYLTAFTLNFTINGVLQYENRVPIFVSYQNTRLVCIPVVKLSGCSMSWKNKLSFTKSNSITISSNVVYIDDGKYVSTSVPNPVCEKDANYYWAIWHNANWGNNNPIYEYYKEKTLYFDPYTLDFGNYILLLQVNVVQKEYSTNFHYCYFNITFKPFIAFIYGGSERSITKRVGLTLSSASSQDPNMPLNKQGHLKAYWSCVDVLNPKHEICEPSLPLPVSSTYFVPSDKLSYGTKYNITLKIWTDYYNDCKDCGLVTPAYAFAIITVTNRTGLTEDNIFILCLLNCKEKVLHTEQLYLRVKSNSSQTTRKIQRYYTWTYFEKGKTEEMDVKSIAVDELPEFMLIVKENALESGKSYTIVVRTLNKDLFAKYSFETEHVEFTGNCSINPNTGTKGLTLFKITCENFGVSSVYEFYDKNEDEANAGLIFNGRMLGTSELLETAELKDFRVTRGNVFVYIIDKSGLYTHKQFEVTLSPWEVSTEVLEEIFHNITELINQGDTANALEYISSVPDIIPPEMDKVYILDRLLRFIVLVPSDTLANIKLTTLTLSNVLLSLNKPVQLAIKPKLMKYTTSIINNQTTQFGRIVHKGNDLKGMSPKEIRILASTQLNCLYACLMCKDPKTVGVTEFDYDLETLYDLMEISKSAVEIIDSVKDILTILQAPGQPPTKVEAAGNSTVLWVMENDEEYNLTNYLSKYTDIPLKLTDKSIKEFTKDDLLNQGELAVRVSVLDENIFWWSKSDVKSNLVSLSLATHSGDGHLKRIKFVENAVEMQMKLHSDLNSTMVTGITMEYDSTTKCTLEKDLAINIYRIDPIPQGLITLRFIYPPTNGSLLVHVQESYRPDCETMKESETISERSPNYPSKVCSQEQPTYFYVGIISNTNKSVTYTFEVNTTVCQFWATGHWSTQGCKISSHKTKDLEVHCACDHFSMFAAAFPVPPQEIDLFSDIKLFLTVFDNPIIVSFISLLFIIYLFCCFWAWRKDKNDKVFTSVIVLEDNFPDDPYPYLLAIFTSSRFNAGTTAHVGLRLEGSLEISRSHVLTSKDRTVLKRNHDDWFLIYCPEQLGDLQSVHLWHDNAGSSPDWFCDKIIVYDLVNQVEIVFVVEQWLALRLEYYPEAVVRRASVDEVNDVKRIFLDNFILGLREGHSLLFILMRHPRSEISRLQKISILMSFITISMLCSIMFYSPQTDDSHYTVGLRDFYISLQSIVICLFVTFIILFAFKSVTKVKHDKDRKSKRKRTNESVKQKTVYSNFVRLVSKTLKARPLIATQLNNSEPIIIVRKTWLLVSWTLCVAVILICSFFVILYGFKLGFNTSMTWLSTVLFTIIGELLVITPIKITFYSIILSLAFQRLCDVSNHRITAENALKVQRVTDEDKFKKLLIKRNHPMYTQLRFDARREMLRVKELWNNWWTVIDFTVALIFTFIVSIVVYELWSSHYYSNSHVYDIMTASHLPNLGSESFFDSKNMVQVNHYLQHSFFVSLYNTFWYNHKPIEEKGIDRQYWAEDFVHSLVGYQRYRQIRVYPVKCKSALMNTTQECVPEFSSCCEETDDYGLRWKPAQWHDIEKTNSPWKYKSRTTDPLFTMYRLCGGSGTVYHDGGYSAYLGPTRTKADSVVYEMISNDWQDQLTRAVFVELTLFNINLDLFSQVTMIVEYLITGNIQLKAQVVSVESKMKLDFWNGFFVIFIIYFIVRSGFLINRQGMMEHLSSYANWTRLCVIFLGVLSVFIATAHFFSSSAYYTSFIQSGYKDAYFDFDQFIFNFLYLQTILSALVCVAMYRTILIFRGGRTLLTFFYTFTTSLHWLLWLTVIVGIFLFLQLPLVLLLDIALPHSKQDIIIIPRFTNILKVQGLELIYVRILFYVKSVTVSLIMGFYIVIFMYYYKLARTYKIKKSDEFNILTFFVGLIARKTPKLLTK